MTVARIWYKHKNTGAILCYSTIEKRSANQQQGADEVRRDWVLVAALHLCHVRREQLRRAKDIQYLAKKRKQLPPRSSA